MDAATVNKHLYNIYIFQSFVKFLGIDDQPKHGDLFLELNIIHLKYIRNHSKEEENYHNIEYPVRRHLP